MSQVKKYGELFILILFLLTIAIALTINAKWLYLIDIDTLNILDYVDISQSELVKNYDELMRYLNFFWIKSLEMSDFPVSQSGALHFYEVKRLFQFNYIVLLITAIPSIIILKNKIKTKTLWLFNRSFSYLLAGLMVLIMFMAVGFDTFFVKFHEIFFNNNAWVFDPSTDPIILVLPQDYFMHCFILFFLLFVSLLIIIILLGKRQLKSTTKIG